MTSPAFRPMPRTVHMVTEEGAPSVAGAIKRAHHRVVMRLRWRDPELRAEDKQKRRLPQDWHAWMHCPAVDGYKTAGCTCDQWMSAERPTNDPAELTKAEREARAKLQRELRYSMKERAYAEESGQALGGRREIPDIALWVKSSIDTAIQPNSILVRSERTAHGSLEMDNRIARKAAHVVAIRRRAQGQRAGQRAGRSGPWPQRAEGRRLGRGNRLRIPAWLATAGRYLSSLRLSRG